MHQVSYRVVVEFASRANSLLQLLLPVLQSCHIFAEHALSNPPATQVCPSAHFYQLFFFYIYQIMDQLRSIFPDLDQATLEATLEAHGNSVERAVDYLLSAPAREDHRSVQEAQDEALARRLQAEDFASSRHTEHTLPGMFNPTSRPPSNARDNSSSTTPSFALPSLEDVQTAVRPIVDGVVYAGKVAADSVSGLYRDFVGNSAAPSRSSMASSRMDDSVVIRGEGSSPAATRGTARQRRPDPNAASRSFGDKKDD